MKIKVALLALLCAVMANAGQSTTGANSDSNTVSLSMDVSADLDDGYSSSSDLHKSSSQEYASYSSNESPQSTPEFGMRKPSNVDYGQSQSAQDQYDQSSSNSDSNGPSSQSYVTREFIPSVYKPMSQSQYGQQSQQQSDAGEADSYFYGKSTPGQSDSLYSSQENGENGSGAVSSFTPISMSVEEAFQKYFPSNKLAGKDSAEQSYSQQQPQQQQQPDSLEQGHRHHQYISSNGAASYSDNPVESSNDHLQQNANSKPVFSIDSLREIVEKQPLAQPNPFDPPSPPLSAFLAPPPNSQQVETLPVPSPHVSSDDSSMYADQYSPVSELQQTYGQPQIQTKYIYAKEPVVSQGGNENEANQPSSNLSEEDVDEGLAYATKNADSENDKKMFVYSRPVRLPDLTRTKIVDSYDVNTEGNNNNNQNSIQQANYGHPQNGEHIYRKPVSYEEDKLDQESGIGSGEQSGQVGYGDDMSQRPQYPQGALDNFQGQMGDKHSPVDDPYGNPSQGYQDKGEYNVLPQSQQWNNMESGQVDDYDNGNSEGKGRIEYGFRPIKNEGQNAGKFYDAQEPKVSHKAPYDMSPVKSFDYQQQQQQQQYPQEPQQQYQHGQQQQQYPQPPQQQQYTPQQQQQYPPQQQQQYPPQQQQGPGGYNGITQQQDINEPGLDRPQNGFKFPGSNYLSNMQNIRFKPFYGKEAMKKLNELGINEDEFYGTVNKILQKSRVFDKSNYSPNKAGPNRPYVPRINRYRIPPKNMPRHKPYSMGPKNRPMGNNMFEDFDYKLIKDELPPGASYNPRDVGLDESVLAQIHLLDSGIGGYRFPGFPQNPASLNSRPAKSRRPNGLLSRRPVPYKKSKDSFQSPSNSIPYAMNSISMPFFFTGPNLFASSSQSRLPYSSSGKGFRSQYGYKAAASELNPQFMLPKTKPFKFLGQPVAMGAPTTTSGVSSLLGSSASDDSLNSALGNIFGIKPIKGIKSLVSYLTGGVSG